MSKINTDGIQKYYVVDGIDDKDVQDDYQVLRGPRGFKCVITEPEDRTFDRDLAPIRDELDRLQFEIDRLKEGPWEPKRRMWEKMIEQRTKEACFKAGWKWYVKFDTRRSTFGEAKEAFKQAIDSVGNQS